MWCLRFESQQHFSLGHHLSSPKCTKWDRELGEWKTQTVLNMQHVQIITHTCTCMYRTVPGKRPWTFLQLKHQNWRWAVAQRRCLNGSTILVQAPTVCAKDLVAHEMHQNDRTYVCELSGLTFGALHKNLTWWAVTWRTSKKPQNWRVGTTVSLKGLVGNTRHVIYQLSLP